MIRWPEIAAAIVHTIVVDVVDFITTRQNETVYANTAAVDVGFYVQSSVAGSNPPLVLLYEFRISGIDDTFILLAVPAGNSD